MSTEANLDIMAMYTEFAATENGQHLAEQVRYERYKPEEVSNERWVEVLGVDVNNLGHMQLTWGLTKDMVRQLRIQQPGFLDEHEEQVLEVMAIIHDRGEAIVGDITFSEKNEEVEAAERDALADMVSGSGELIREAAETIDTETKLGFVFNTIERVGYMRTALRAAKHVLDGTAPDCEDGLRWIVADVLGNQPTALLRRINEHAPLHGYFHNQAARITDAFSAVRPRDFQNYMPEDQPAKTKAFHDAYALWQEWLQNNG